ncbi:MAG: caspase family protein [Rhodospirillales bacterium]|nr:caspase family protein [Rhodospirillales bacterium]
MKSILKSFLFIPLFLLFVGTAWAATSEFDYPVIIDASAITFKHQKTNIPVHVRVLEADRIYMFPQQIKGPISMTSTYRLKLGAAVQAAAPMLFGQYLDVSISAAEEAPVIELKVTSFTGDTVMRPTGSSGTYSYRMNVILQLNFFDRDRTLIDSISATGTKTESFKYNKAEELSRIIARPDTLLSATLNDLLANFFASQKVTAALERLQGTVVAGTPTSNFPTNRIDFKFPKSTSHPDDIAVIIGNADYTRQGKDIPDIIPARADAEAFRSYVTQALGVREGNIIELHDATSAQLVRVFGSKDNPRGQLFDWVRPGRSNVVIYYAGHGAPGNNVGNAYIIPTDADGTRIDLNGYGLSTLYNNLSKIPAKSITVVLEACFSGAAEGGSVISNASPVFLKTKVTKVPYNVTVIAAGGSNQMASWEKDKSHGLFTKYFLTGMSGEADANPYGNGDGRVDYAELEKYLKETLTYYARRYYGRDQNAVITVGSEG